MPADFGQTSDVDFALYFSLVWNSVILCCEIGPRLTLWLVQSKHFVWVLAASSQSNAPAETHIGSFKVFLENQSTLSAQLSALAQEALASFLSK